MAYLTVEFTGRITANDEEIRAAVERANQIFADAGVSAEKAHQDNMASVENDGEQTALWSAADFAATKDMGEGALLAWH